jgi:ATP-dependent Clp protease ATP-binding subunit ClpA
MNRLDKVVVFRRLTDESMRSILELELQAVQGRILKLNQGRFILRYTEDARRFLLVNGTSARYGARELKRTIERYVVLPLSNLIATKQINEGDILHVDLDEGESSLIFMKRHASSVSYDPYEFRFDQMRVAAGAAR